MVVAELAAATVAVALSIARLAQNAHDFRDSQCDHPFSSARFLKIIEQTRLCPMHEEYLEPCHDWDSAARLAEMAARSANVGFTPRRGCHGLPGRAAGAHARARAAAVGDDPKQSGQRAMEARCARVGDGASRRGRHGFPGRAAGAHARARAAAVGDDPKQSQDCAPIDRGAPGDHRMIHPILLSRKRSFSG
jgi:hypothetical protein